MLFHLTNGDTVDCSDAPVGEGATGTVYLSRNGRHAVKILKKNSPEMRSSLSQVVAMRDSILSKPHWTSTFCWPDGLVDQGSLGIRMPAIPAGFRPLSSFVLSKSYSTLSPAELRWDFRLVAALRLARGVDWLHKNGVGHSDLSRNNVYYQATTGQPYLIDLDGVVISGQLDAKVLGTPEYIAPELLAGKGQPSRITDLHALAVLVHQLLLFRHPLRGPKTYHPDPAEDERRALGEDAVFISHPSDRSNQPRTLGHGYWPTKILGAEMDSLFVAAFVDGLRHPQRRPTAKQWEEALVRLHDRVVGCIQRHCHERTFPFTSQGGLLRKERHCPWCGTAFPSIKFPIMHLMRPSMSNGREQRFTPDGDWWIAATPGRTLHRWHQFVGQLPQPGENNDSIAIVCRDQRGRWWLQIETDDAAISEVSSSRVAASLPRGHAVRLAEGVQLRLGEPPHGRAIYVQMCGGFA
jgi:DNA-binding helix-hairpin-helix protein with protein kinase domain